AQVAFGIPMALEAPGHEERLPLIGELHLLDRAMADIAVNAAGNVNAVVEVDELRQLVHPRPANRAGRRPYRRLSPVARPHRLQKRTIGPDLGMAGHAGVGGRDSGERGLLYGGVAVAAVDA